jgi:3-phenylpropionate/trans-cinnamate dioxygenase ferredoxin reductase subunit
MGLHVTLIESMPEIWPRFADRQLACFVREHCESRGLVVRTGQQLDAILGEDGVTAVRLRGGETISCDLVCVGIGVIPNVELALEASLEVENGIVVNHRMQTSNANIFSAGDVANYPDPVAKVRKRAEHWGHAEYSGQIAGANMSGGAIEYDFMSYVWSDIFDLHLEAAGDEGGGTTSIRRGMMTTSGFTMLYLDDDRLISYCGLNANPKEFTALRKLIRNGTSLKGREDELADPSIPIKSFL